MSDILWEIHFRYEHSERLLNKCVTMETANSSALCIELGDVLVTCKFDEKVTHGVCLIYDVEIKMDSNY